MNVRQPDSGLHFFEGTRKEIQKNKEAILPNATPSAQGSSISERERTQKKINDAASQKFETDYSFWTQEGGKPIFSISNFSDIASEFSPLEVRDNKEDKRNEKINAEKMLETVAGRKRRKTPEEIEESKRLAAQKSRDKKKLELKSLRDRIEVLESENGMLKQQNQNLSLLVEELSASNLKSQDDVERLTLEKKMNKKLEGMIKFNQEE